MAILTPLLKVLPFGKKKDAHEPGDTRAALAGHRPEKPDTDAGQARAFGGRLRVHLWSGLSDDRH